jgi:hypothetical protein
MTLPLRDRHERQLRKYGLTEELWKLLWDAQKGCCAICTKRFAPNRLPCVDHNHETGEVRGLLCPPCNYAVGERHDDAVWFRRAADYLDYPPALREAIHVFAPGSIGEHRAQRP